MKLPDAEFPLPYTHEGYAAAIQWVREWLESPVHRFRREAEIIRGSKLTLRGVIDRVNLVRFITQ